MCCVGECKYITDWSTLWPFCEGHPCIVLQVKYKLCLAQWSRLSRGIEGGRDHCLFTLCTIPAGLEAQTRNLRVTRPTL